MNIRALGRLGGLARAAALTPERRSEIARRAAVTRWRGALPPESPCAAGHRACEHYEALLAEIVAIQRDLDFCLTCTLPDESGHQTGCALTVLTSSPMEAE